MLYSFWSHHWGYQRIYWHIKYSCYYFLFKLRSLHYCNLLNPIFDEVFLVKSKDNLIKFIFNFEMKWFFLILRISIFFHFSPLYKIIGSIILILFIKINVNEIFTHNCNIPFPNFGVGIFHMNISNFGGLIHNLGFFAFYWTSFIILYLITLLKTLVYFQEIVISKLVNINLQFR